MRTLVCLLLVTSAVTLAMRSSRAQEPSFGVKMSSPTAEFTVGSPIRVNVTLVNHSQRMLSFFDPRCRPTRITVRDDNQAVLELRDEFRQGDFITCVSQFLDPSKSMTLQLNIAKWFDLSRPGRYFVQLAPTGVSRDGTRETQKSNVLEIRIAQRQ
jgi:hypothetical protein